MKRKCHILILLFALLIHLQLLNGVGGSALAGEIDRAKGIEGDLIRIREKAVETKGLVDRVLVLNRAEGEALLGDATRAVREILVHSLKVRGKLKRSQDFSENERQDIGKKLGEAVAILKGLKSHIMSLGPPVWEEWLIWPAKGISMDKIEELCLVPLAKNCELMPCIECCRSSFSGDLETDLKGQDICRWECLAHYLECAVEKSEKALSQGSGKATENQ